MQEAKVTEKLVDQSGSRTTRSRRSSWSGKVKEEEREEGADSP